MPELCKRCSKPEGALGHETNNCRVYGRKNSSVTADGTQIPRHMCCPDACEFDQPAELEAEIVRWRERQDVLGLVVLDFIEEAQRKLRFARKLARGLDKSS